MKTIKNLVMGSLFLLLFGSTLNAAPQQSSVEFKPDLEDIRIVQQQVIKFLSNKNFDLKGTVDLSIVLYLNEENEIVVLNVSTKNKELREFLLKNLNGKRFADNLDRKGYTYICPMRIRGAS